jgi:hypothetical protein
MQVTPHPQCVVSVIILGSAGSSTGREFFFTGLAVVPLKTAMLLPMDRTANSAFRFYE